MRPMIFSYSGLPRNATSLAKQFRVNRPPIALKVRMSLSPEQRTNVSLAMTATKDVGTLMLRFVQDQPQPLRQVWQAVRFVDDRKFLGGMMTLQYFTRVARSEQDPYVLVQ